MRHTSLQVEHARLAELHRHAIAGTPPEVTYDLIAQGAAHLLRAPIALVTFIDAHRQWFKAAVGTELRDMPRELAFCTHALTTAQTLVVPDTAEDARFRNHPLVTGEPHLRFYAGAPIMTGGLMLGTVCVLDMVPRQPTDRDLHTLHQLARITANLIEHDQHSTLDAGVPRSASIDVLIMDDRGRNMRLLAPASTTPGVVAKPSTGERTEVPPIRGLSGRQEAGRAAQGRGPAWTERGHAAGATARVTETGLTVVPAPGGANAALYVWNRRL